MVAAITLWNTVYQARSIRALREQGQQIEDELLQHLSPLGWEHSNLIGDYIWRQIKLASEANFAPYGRSARPIVLSFREMASIPNALPRIPFSHCTANTIFQ